MPIPTTPEFQETVAGPHTAKHRLDTELNGAVVKEFKPTKGSVTVDNGQTIRRHCSFELVSEDYNLQTAADLFNPLTGVILRPYSGVEIPSVLRLSIVVDTEAQWNEGTLTDILVTPEGSITIA
jgi:hypothetical protein